MSIEVTEKKKAFFNDELVSERTAELGTFDCQKLVYRIAPSRSWSATKKKQRPCSAILYRQVLVLFAAW